MYGSVSIKRYLIKYTSLYVGYISVHEENVNGGGVYALCLPAVPKWKTSMMEYQ